MALTAVPSPRSPRSPESAASSESPGLRRRPLGASDRVRRFYENELGWTTVPGPSGAPVRLRTGVRFDVLDVPAGAGRAALRHLAPASPVALRADRMWLLVAEGSAEELPGLLDWLEWGPLRPDIRALGAGGCIAAPWPVRGLGSDGSRNPYEPCNSPEPCNSKEPGNSHEPWNACETRKPGPRGAAVWLRPPEPGCGVERVLPTLSALGGDGDAAAGPSLVRVVDTVATQYHRIRLRRADGQALACS